MIKATRIAVAAAFGVAATLPAFADFDNNGPSDKQGQHIMQSTSELNPPALDSGSTVVADNRATDSYSYQGTDGRIYERADTGVNSDQSAMDRTVPSDRDYVVAENRPHEGRFHRFFHRDHASPDRANAFPDRQPYSSEAGAMSSWSRSQD